MPMLKIYIRHHPKYKENSIIQWSLTFHLLIPNTNPIWKNEPKQQFYWLIPSSSWKIRVYFLAIATCYREKINLKVWLEFYILFFPSPYCWRQLPLLVYILTMLLTAALVYMWTSITFQIQNVLRLSRNLLLSLRL